MTVQGDARALLYTQMSRGYVRQSEVVRILVRSGAGTSKDLEPIVAGELSAMRKLTLSAMIADASEHGADVEALRKSVVGAVNVRFGT